MPLSQATLSLLSPLSQLHSTPTPLEPAAPSDRHAPTFSDSIHIPVHLQHTQRSHAYRPHSTHAMFTSTSGSFFLLFVSHTPNTFSFPTQVPSGLTQPFCLVAFLPSAGPVRIPLCTHSSIFLTPSSTCVLGKAGSLLLPHKAGWKRHREAQTLTLLHNLGQAQLPAQFSLPGVDIVVPAW